jgi:hypothetical protein
VVQLQRISPISRQLLSMTLHLDYPIVTQGHQLTGLTPVAKPNRAHRSHPCSQPKPSTRPDPNQPYPTNRVKGPCHSWPWARLSWQFTLYRGCTILLTGWWYSISQPAKHSHWGFTATDYTILQKSPLVPRLGLHHPLSKVGITSSFHSISNIHETGK